MKRIEKLIEAVKPYYQKNTDPAHDWPHITRVAACALKLASLEKADVPCTLAAVYCHDLVNLPKDHPDRIKSSALAAGEARPLLEQAGFNAEEIKKIQSAVVEH